MNGAKSVAKWNVENWLLCSHRARVPPTSFDTFLPNRADVTLELEECNNDEAQDGLLKGRYDAIFLWVKVFGLLSNLTL